MLWFSVAFIDHSSNNSDQTPDVLSHRMCGTFADSDALETGVEEVEKEAAGMGDDVSVIPVRFELVDDDVPELVD